MLNFESKVNVLNCIKDLSKLSLDPQIKIHETFYNKSQIEEAQKVLFDEYKIKVDLEGMEDNFSTSIITKSIDFDGKCSRKLSRKQPFYSDNTLSCEQLILETEVDFYKFENDIFLKIPLANEKLTFCIVVTDNLSKEKFEYYNSNCKKSLCCCLIPKFSLEAKEKSSSCFSYCKFSITDTKDVEGVYKTNVEDVINVNRPFYFLVFDNEFENVMFYGYNKTPTE